MAFEKKVPQWKARGTEPPKALIEGGYDAGYKPPAAFFNWFWNRVSEALTELQDNAISENMIETTSEIDLNDFNTVDYLGPWYCGGANNVKNKPTGVDSFSLVVVRTATGYFTQVLTAGNKETNKTFVRTYGAGAWSDWDELAFTSGNVASATKLETARKINGIPFDGTADICVGCIGYEPIKTTEDDTVANWKALGSGFAIYTTTRLHGQPTDYGFVVQYVYNSLLYQEFHSMPTGGQWYRKGNNTGWWNDATNKGTWRKVYDELNKPEKLAVARNINGVPFDGSANIEINPIATLIDSTRDMNLNSYSTIGHLGFWYAVGGNAIENKPDGVDAFGLLVMRSASGYFTQILVAGSSNTNIIYNRTYNGKTWTDWASMYSGCNKPSPADIGAVNKNGDTMTGWLKFNGATIGHEWTTADGTKFQMRPYSPNNLFQITTVGSATEGKTKASFNIRSDGTVYTGEALALGTGGTGATTAKAAEYNINGGMVESTETIGDDHQITFKRTTPSTTNGVFIYKKASMLWAYILGKIRSTFGFSSDNVLPRSNGGTGASTLNGAQKNLFTTQSIESTDDILALTNGFYHYQGDTLKKYNWPVEKSNWSFEVVVQGNRNPAGGYWYVMVMDMYTGTIYYNHYYWSEWKGWKKITTTAV